MDEQTFLIWLFDKYNLSDFAMEAQIPKYKGGLISGIDYYRLQRYIETEYPLKSMPSAAELNKTARMLNFFQNKKCPSLEHIEALMREPKPDFSKIPEDMLQRMRAVLKRVGYKSKIKELQY